MKNKKEYFGFLTLSLILTGIILLTHTDDYAFEPDHDITRVMLMDQIDSDEKLQSILLDSAIKKELTPVIGSFIKQYEHEMVVRDRFDVEEHFYLELLEDIEIHDYNKGYLFIPNTISRAKVALEAQKISDDYILNKIRRNIKVQGRENIKMGSYIYMDLNGGYHVLKQENYYSIRR